MPLSDGLPGLPQPGEHLLRVVLVVEVDSGRREHRVLPLPASLAVGQRVAEQDPAASAGTFGR